jgi:hypothetical protein
MNLSLNMLNINPLYCRHYVARVFLYISLSLCVYPLTVKIKPFLQPLLLPSLLHYDHVYYCNVALLYFRTKKYFYFTFQCQLSSSKCTFLFNLVLLLVYSIGLETTDIPMDSSIVKLTLWNWSFIYTQRAVWCSKHLRSYKHTGWFRRNLQYFGKW